MLKETYKIEKLRRQKLLLCSDNISAKLLDLERIEKLEMAKQNEG